jgi:predicted MPP superfamily phosphohydrolase
MKYSGFILFFIFILASITGIIYYLSNRFNVFFPSLSFKSLIWGFSGTTLLVLTGIIISFLIQSPVEKLFFVLSVFWITILLFLLTFVVLLDLVNIVYKISPLLRGIISLAITFLLIIYGTINASVIKIKRISIPISGLTKEIRAIHISDIHLGYFYSKKRLDKIVNKIIELNPDLVFNTGDMFDTKTHFYKNSDILDPLSKLAIPHYFVYGNHDEQSNIEEVINRMKAAGAIVLQNEITLFGELQIIGLNNMLQDERKFDIHANQSVETIKSVLNKLSVDENLPTVALHHRPTGLEYLNAKKVNLLLTGHTHAGQLFPFIFIVKAMYKYNTGLYLYKNLNIYVTAGVGTAAMPIRIGTCSEITFIRLIPKET